MTLKSMPQGRATGRPGGLTFNDGLSNLATGMGTSADKNMYNRWGAMADGSMPSVISQPQIDAAYRSSWLVRKVHDVLPGDMTKAWREWASAKKDQIDLLTAEDKRLGLKEKTKRALSIARQCGGAALIMGLPGNAQSEAPAKIGKGALKYVHVVSRDQVTVEELDRDLLSPNFNKPTAYNLTGGTGVSQQIHPSRVIVFHGMPVPYTEVAGGSVDAFWGAPLMESINEAMQHATLAPGALMALLQEAKSETIHIPGLMGQISTQEYEDRLARRLQIAALMKSMFNVQILDGGTGDGKTGEQWETRQLNFAALPDVVRVVLQIAAGAANMPLTKLIGSPPEGMNATGEHDEDNWQETVRDEQQDKLQPPLEQIDPYLIMSALGSKPDDVTWKFASLKEDDPTEEAEVDGVIADTFDILVKSGLIQHDALAQVLVSTLDKRRNFPGLAEAVEKSTEVLPVTAAQEAAQAGDLTGGGKTSAKGGKASGGAARKPQAANENAQHDITVNGPGGLSIKAKVRKADAITVQDGVERPLYVSRKVLNPQELLRWARAAGVPNLEPAGELHVTITFSRDPVDWMAMGSDWSGDEQGRIRMPAGGPRDLDLFGPDRSTLVLEIVNEQLEWRHQRMVDKGASWDWPSYKPHITIAKDLPADFDLSTLRPYSGRIILGPEIFQELRQDDGEPSETPGDEIAD